jgi:AcrR family transcriptional regulator
MDISSISIYPELMMATASRPAEIVSTGKRAVTRARICDCANALFFDQGFSAVTMEEIAQAVGIRRSTLYLHFGDKEEILTAIAEDYTAKLRQVIARLPGPEPSYAEIAAWVEEMADFVIDERAATELLVSLSHQPKAPRAALAFGAAFKEMMASRLAAFRRALEPGEALAFARAMAAVDGLGWALCHHARAGGDTISKARLTVAADALDRLVRGES